MNDDYFPQTGWLRMDQDRSQDVFCTCWDRGRDGFDNPAPDCPLHGEGEM